MRRRGVWGEEQGFLGWRGDGSNRKKVEEGGGDGGSKEVRKRGCGVWSTVSLVDGVGGGWRYWRESGGGREGEREGVFATFLHTRYVAVSPP